MEKKQKKEYTEEDVVIGRIDHLFGHRIPWLFLGVLGGLLAAIIVSKYKAILSADVRLAFFYPHYCLFERCRRNTNRNYLCA